MTLTASHKRAMQAGRKRAETERARNGIERVKAYRRWLRAGSKGAPPCVPSDRDYAYMRGSK